jgi:dTDP-4-dehydrorhamnose reductase
MKETILLTGGSGLLALNWAVQKRDNYNVVLGIHDKDVSLQGVESVKVNLDSEVDFEAALKRLKPDLVIHTAGLTSVEACEKNPELANHVNVELARNVAKSTALFGIKMVQISTDHLFVGDKPFMIEGDPVDPCNVYGSTKAAAEIAVGINPESLIVRTNFYGWGPGYRNSFSDVIISTLSAGRQIVLFENVFYSPILIETLVDTVHDLIDLDAKGTFNIVSAERISKYQFGLMLARQFNLDESLIKKGLLQDNLNLVKRPLDMSLSNSKATSLLSRNITSLEDQIQILYDQKMLKSIKEIQNL